MVSYELLEVTVLLGIIISLWLYIKGGGDWVERGLHGNDDMKPLPDFF